MGIDRLSLIESIFCLVRALLLEGTPETRRFVVLIVSLLLVLLDPRLCTPTRWSVSLISIPFTLLSRGEFAVREGDVFTSISDGVRSWSNMTSNPKTSKQCAPNDVFTTERKRLVVLFTVSSTDINVLATNLSMLRRTYVIFRTCMCVCVCMRERERERGR